VPYEPIPIAKLLPRGHDAPHGYALPHNGISDRGPEFLSARDGSRVIVKKREKGNGLSHLKKARSAKSSSVR
jgi:hypothetical protein